MSAAIERHGQNASDGGLADAAVAAEDVAMRDPLLLNRIFQGAGDVFLTNHLGKTLRTVFTRQNLIAHAELRLYPCREKRFSTGRVACCWTIARFDNVTCGIDILIRQEVFRHAPFPSLAAISWRKLLIS